MLIFDEVMDRLKVKRLSSIASLMTNHWILDGTYRLLDDKSRVGEMTKEILQFDEKTRLKSPLRNTMMQCQQKPQCIMGAIW